MAKADKDVEPKEPTYKPRESYKLALPGEWENSDVESFVLKPYRNKDIYHATLTEEACRRKKKYKGAVPEKDRIVRMERFSTINGMWEKTALIQWAANKASQHLYRNILPRHAYDERYLLDALEAARFAWQDERDEAGTYGTQVHKIIEDFLRSGEVDWPGCWDEIPVPVQNSLRCFSEWWPTADLEVLQVEKYVYSMALAFGGRTDLLCKCRKTGKMGVADWKTSRDIYPGFLMQIYAYCGALIELGYPIEFGLICRFGREERKAQIHRIEREEIEEGWRHWKLCCYLWPFWKQMKSRANKSNREHQKEMLAGFEAKRERDFEKWLAQFSKEESAWLAALTETFMEER